MQTNIETHIMNGNIKQNKKLLYKVLIVVLSSALIAASAQVTIRIATVPFTLQTFSVMFLSLVLGRRLAVLSVFAYITEILLGMPVMSSFHTLNPMSIMNFGYILACLPLAWYFGSIKSVPTKLSFFIKALIANLIVYAIGLLWLGAFIGYNANLLLVGFVPFIIPDMIKAIVALKLAKSITNN